MRPRAAAAERRFPRERSKQLLAMRPAHGCRLVLPWLPNSPTAARRLLRAVRPGAEAESFWRGTAAAVLRSQPPVASGPFYAQTGKGTAILTGRLVDIERCLSRAERSGEARAIRSEPRRIRYWRAAFQGRSAGVARRSVRVEYGSGGSPRRRRLRPAPVGES